MNQTMVASPSAPDDIRAYILDMAEQLAQLAMTIGDSELAVALREAVETSTVRPDDQGRSQLV